MPEPLPDILVVDDDKFSRSMIVRALQDSYQPRTAEDGETGLALAMEKCPDVILLDVEMPGLNGYEVCDRLRSAETTRNTPIVFLSSHGDLRERMQGYEVGADDYIVKPFEAENLKAKISVLLKYREQKREMEAQYQEAQKTAFIAMTGSSELGQALLFIEKSYAYRDYDELAQGFFTVTDWLGLNCMLHMIPSRNEAWFSSAGSIKPLEQELMNLIPADKRFFDFGQRTMVSFPNVRLLVKNMPLDDMERYGRIKDLLPIVLSSVNAKISSLDAELALHSQSQQLSSSMNNIRGQFLTLSKSLTENQQNSNTIMRSMLHDLNHELPKMGLEEDQEEFILNRIEKATVAAMQVTDTGQTIRDTFSNVLQNLQQIVEQQDHLLADFISSQQQDDSGDEDQESYNMDVELF